MLNFRLKAILFALVVSVLTCVPVRGEIPLPALEKAVSDRMADVPEFVFLRQEAARLGVRVWLFGGTAAAYAHYVKWDELRKGAEAKPETAENPRFQPDRFDYDYTNIYRASQDLDIVVDGPAEKAEELERLLKRKFAYLQGSKEKWEVRLLRELRNGKEPLLDNPNFIEQHTDSNSTGMVEISVPPAGEGVVRDLKEWNAKEPFFLKDVAEGKLHYYFSPTHGNTSRAKQGLNPPIISAIRYLTKAFQFELEMREEDLAKVQEIIRDFDPEKDAKNKYVAEWIEKNARKLIQNAVNIEYACKKLDELGLRKKLIALGKNPSQPGSLAWWMTKEPLRTKPLGEGTGPTAAELKLDIVAHETGDFAAYESMTRAHTGTPNVLVSRSGINGERAIHGDGFYVRTGREGAVGTKITVRFHLDPRARLGTDFLKTDDYLIVLNKAALKVIPESLNLTPLDYFRLLADGVEIAPEERAVLEKFKRRLRGRIRALTEQDSEKIYEIVVGQMKNPTARSRVVLTEWLGSPLGDARRLLTTFDSLSLEQKRPLVTMFGQIRVENLLLRAIVLKSARDADPELRQRAMGAILRSHDLHDFPPEAVKAAFDQVERAHLEEISPKAWTVVAPMMEQAFVDGNERLIARAFYGPDHKMHERVFRHIAGTKPGVEMQAGLVHMLQSQSWEYRRSAVRALGASGAISREIFDGLLTRTQDYDREVKAAAIEALKTLPFPQASRDKWTSEAARNPRGSALLFRAALTWLPDGDPEFFSLLASGLNGNDDNTRIQASYRLARAKKTDAATHPSLLTLLSSTSWEVRQAAVVALGASGARDKVTYQAVLRSTEDHDKDARAVAVRALAELSVPEAQRAKYVAELVRTPGLDALLLKALLPLVSEHDEMFFPFVREQLSHISADVRRNAANRLHDTAGRSEPETHKALLKASGTDTSWEVRRAAVRALGVSGLTDKGTFVEVLRRCSDYDKDVRKAAAETLAALTVSPELRAGYVAELVRDPSTDLVLLKSLIPLVDKNDPEFHKFAVPLLKHEDAEVRALAAAKLSEAAKNPNVLIALRAALADKSWETRRKAVQAIAQSGAHDKETFFAMLRRTEDYDGDVKAAAREALETMAVPAELRAQYVGELINGPALDAQMLKAVLPAIFESDPRYEAFLIAALGHADRDVRTFAARRLQTAKRTGPATHAALLAHGGDQSWEVRRAVGDALAASGVQDKPTYLALLRFSRDGDKDVVDASAKQLDQLAVPSELKARWVAEVIRQKEIDPKLLEAVIPLVAESDPLYRSFLAPLFGHGTADVRRLAAYRLQLAGKKDPVLHPMLVAAAADKVWQIRRGVARALAASGADDKETFVARLRLAEDGDVDVREACAVEAKEHPFPKEDQARYVAELIRDPSLHGEDLAGVLSLVDEHDPLAAAFLVEKLSDPFPKARRRAASRIGKLTVKTPATRTALIAALSDKTWEVRRAAVNALATFNPGDSEIYAKLLASTHDGDADVRKAASEAVKKLNESKAACGGVMSGLGG